MFGIKASLRISVFVVVFLLITSLTGPAHAACTDSIGCVTIDASDPIHIAYILALSGPNSSLGLEEMRGVEIAIDNAGGQILGHDILFDGQDGECTNPGGSAAAQVLDDDASILAVIGTSCSSAAIGAMPYLSSAGFSVVSPSNTNDSLTKPGDPNHYDGYFRTAWKDSLQGTVAAQYAYNTLGLTIAAIMDDGSSFSTDAAQAFSDEFTNLGGVITTQQSFTSGDTTSMDSALSTIDSGTTPSLLYIPIENSNDAIHIMDNLPTGLGGVQLFGSDRLWDGNINTAANEDGFLITNYDFAATHNPDLVTQFLPSYRTKYSSDPSYPFYAHAYDAFMLIKNAIESVAVETSPGVHEIGRQALRDALHGTSNMSGLTGTITCNADGDCADPSMSVYTYQADQFPPIYTYPTKVGLVLNVGGLNDGFGSTAYQGIQQAQTDFGIAQTLYWPADSSEFDAYFNQCSEEGNILCFGVGWDMMSAIENTAGSYPNINYAGLDVFFPDPIASNTRGILFNEKQAGYLAGTLAGKMTATKKVGVVAGIAIPPVIAFAEGYRNGAQCASSANVFIDYTGTFIDPDVGEASAQTMINNGADVIFAAAGLTGNGALLYSTQNGVWGIGVDGDQYLSLFEDGMVSGADKLLSSAMKRLDSTVYDTIDDQLNDVFSSGNIVYDLADNGVGLAPFHEADGSIPQSVKDYIDTVKQGIINDTVNIDITCKPIFKSQGTNDGWVLESSETSGKGGTLNKGATTINVGDDAANKQYRSILSFNTASLPDNAVITKVMLRVKRAGVVGGGNPITTFNGFMVDMKKGSFGTSALALSDFNAKAGKTLGAFKPSLSGGWYAINLTTGKGQVNLTGLTQIRLRFRTDDNNNFITNFLKLYSGNAGSSSRPQLIIEYYIP